jgi:hypothetical protein
MAQTDARAGFRLPWNSDRPNSEESDTDLVNGQGPNDVPVASESSPEGEPMPHEGVDTMTAEAATSDSSRKPSKFMADLSRAMQAAAEEARAQTLEGFAAEAKAYVEQIHARSTDEAADLRRQADDDVAAVREWSKTEIARIRDETDTRIGRRKAELESEIEEHAAQIEREIDRVRTRVAAFEGEMTSFFERLLAEDDPTKIARMAERLPEPPPFDEMSAIGVFVSESRDAAPSAALTPESAVPAAEVSANGWSHPAEPTNEPEAAASESIEPDREAAFAAIQAAAEAAAGAEDDSETAQEAAPEAAPEAQAGEAETDTDPDAESDPRLAALALAAGFDAAEQEAAASADAAPDTEEIPEIGNEALAARLAGLVPDTSDAASPSDMKSTQLVVTGLVSVASIASFKRNLGRLPGVSSVGVSSGPDGEFLFAVNHAADVDLSEAIPNLPAFRATVTGSGEATLSVAAHDPESDK